MRLNLRRLLPLGICLVFLLLSSCLVKAESVPVTILGDEVQYDFDSKQAEVFRNVKISYKDITVTADHAYLDQDADILLAMDNVTVIKEGREYKGNRFLYYIKTQQGWLFPVKAEITDEEINGKVFISGEDAFIKGETLRLKKSMFTSCDRDNDPHYHFTSKEIDYYPGDYIAFHQMWYYEGKVRLCYFPYFYVSLKPEDSNNFEVWVGQTYNWGWYLHVGYNYFLNSNSYGKIYTNITERGGDGLGVSHTVKPSATSKWVQDYYINDLSSIGIPYDEFKVGYGYENWTDPKQKYSAKFENWHRYSSAWDSYLETTASFNYYGINPYPNIYFNFSDLYEDPLENATFGVNWSRQIDPTWQYSLQGLLAYNEQLSLHNPTDNFSYTFNSVKNWGWSNLNFTYHEMKVFGAQTYSDNLKPDLLYTIPTWKWPLIGAITLSSRYTILERFPTNETGERFAVDLQKPVITLWQSKNNQFTFNTTPKVQYRNFKINGTESELTAYSEDISVRDQLSKHLNTTVGLGYTESVGETNYFFPYGDSQILPGSSITNSWNWQSPQWNASLNTGYNFNTSYKLPVDIVANWTPNTKQQASFQTEYDWYQGLGQTNFHLSYNPKPKWSLNVGIGYNFQYPSNPWNERSFSAAIEDKLTNKWSYRLQASYNSIQNKLAIGVTDLIYDWEDCRDMVFHFDAVNKEFWFQIRIKAFPEADFTFGRDPMEFIP